MNLTVLRSISATSNKNAHLNKGKAAFLIKAQRMTDLYPKTTFILLLEDLQWQYLKEGFVYSEGAAGITSRSCKTSSGKLPFVVALIGACLEGGKEEGFLPEEDPKRRELGTTD